MQDCEQQASEAPKTGSLREYGEYRKLSQPPDTVSGATAELLEARPSGANNSSNSDATAFKIIAIIAIVAIILGVISSQIGLLQ